MSGFAWSWADVVPGRVAEPHAAVAAAPEAEARTDPPRSYWDEPPPVVCGCCGSAPVGRAGDHCRDCLLGL